MTKDSKSLPAWLRLVVLIIQVVSLALLMYSGALLVAGIWWGWVWPAIVLLLTLFEAFND